MMKETRFKYLGNLPYGLHDMRVNHIEVQEGEIVFFFEDGFTRLKEPYPKVQGKIHIESQDLDFCCVYLLSRFDKYQKFKGEKLSLTEFLSVYSEFSFEIVDELHGYNQVQYSGYLSMPGIDTLREMQIYIYFFGDIVYETEEE